MRVTQPGIVTPEAVVLSFETAGVGSRMLAQLIDLAVQLTAFIAAAAAFSVLGHTPFGVAGVYVAIFVLAFCYPVALETLWRGRTLGKAAMGLRVVTIEGAPIRFRHALIRGALGLVDFWASSGGVAILTVLATKRNQRLGDLAAGTLVLRERTGAAAPASAMFAIPPGWEAYAAGLDVSGLSASDYQAVRAFLLRAGSLDAWTRERLAREIASPLLARLRHTPPAGVSASAFLLCVAALWQRRQRGWPAPPAPPPGGAVWVPDPAGPRPETRPVPAADRPGDGGFVAPP